MIVTYPTFQIVNKVNLQVSTCLTHHWDVPPYTAHDILLSVQIVLSLSVELHVIGNVVVALFARVRLALAVLYQVRPVFRRERTLVRSIWESGAEFLDLDQYTGHYTSE